VLFSLLPPILKLMKRSIMKRFLTVIDSISKRSGEVFSFLWIVVVFVASLEVILRYGFDAPTIWGHETIIFLCGMVYIIGGAYTLYHRKHINVDMVYNRFSPRGRAILDLVTFPCFVLFIGVLLWGGTDRFWGALLIREGSGSPWDPPIYPILLTIPLGAFLILLQGLVKFIRDLTIAIRGRAE